MRMILAAASFALLAACGGGTSNNSAGNSASGANTSAPVAASNPQRENEMRECANDVRSELPAGTDLNAFCGCAVDKMQTGQREREAFEQCATEQGIRPQR
jgi:hypothetical protein